MKLVEFKNLKGITLRGILIHKSNKGVLMLHGFERTTITEKSLKFLLKN